MTTAERERAVDNTGIPPEEDALALANLIVKLLDRKARHFTSGLTSAIAALPRPQEYDDLHQIRIKRRHGIRAVKAQFSTVRAMLPVWKRTNEPNFAEIELAVEQLGEIITRLEP